MKRFLLLLFLVAAPVLAQNPLAAKFPGALAGDVDFGVACNSAHSTLTADINDSTLSIPVAAGAVFCSPAYVSIDYETMKVCSVSGNTLNLCTGGRAVHGSAASHSNGAAVDIWIDSNGFNQVAAELKAIETALGANLSNVASPWTPYGGTIYYTGHVGIGGVPGSVNLFVRGETTTDNVIQQWGAGGGVGGYAALSLYKTADVDGDFLFETYSAGGTADAPKIQFGRLWDASLLVLDVPNWRVAIGSTHPATSTLLVAGGASGAVFGTNDWDETAHTGSGLWVFQGANTGNTYSALDSWGSGGTVATNLALAPFSANLLVGTTSDNSTGAKLQVSGTATLSNSGGVSANNLFLNNDYGSASDLVESNIIFGGRAFGRRWGRIGGQQSMPGTYAWGQLNFYTYSGDVPHTSPDMTLDGYGDLYLNTGRLIANNGVVGTLLLQADKPATDAPSTWPSGASVRRIYGNGYPYDFGHLLTIRGGTSNPVTQLAIAWPGTTAGPSGLWVRGARDNTDVWGPWLQMVGNDGGTYSINVTGNAGYATTALNSAQYATSGSWDTDFLNTLPGQRRWTQIASGVNAPATGWFFAENIRYGDGGNYWGRQLAWGWYDRPGKVFTRDINGGTFGAWMQIPTVAAMSGSDGLGGRIRAADLGCNSWYTDSCDANGDGILDHAAVADSAYQWIGTRQVSFVYGGDPNVVIPATTVDNIWRPESASAATVTKVWCATDAGTVTLSMLRNDHGPAFASGTCGTTGSYLTVTANGYHYIPNAGPGDPNWYGLSFQTSSVSGVHNLSVTVAYTPAY